MMPRVSRAFRPDTKNDIWGTMHRRAFLFTGSVAFAASSVPAWAQQLAQIGSQAEWSQNHDAASRIRVKRSSTPILSGQAAAATEEAIDLYRDIVGRGGWAPLQVDERMRV